MKRFLAFFLLALFLLPLTAFAQSGEAELSDNFDMDQQLDVLGKDELMDQVPEDARPLLDEAGLDDLSVGKLLQLSPKDFFRTIWQLFLQEVKRPMRTLGIVVAVMILCAMLDGLKTAVSENALGQMFTTVAVLGVLTSVATPILDCIVETSAAIKSASTFMLTFIPVFSASLVAAGQPVTGATYNMFLFSTCQVIAQVVSQTLIPLMGIYLALCVVGAIVPEIKIASAAATVKSVVGWVLGFMVTIFVGLLSIQTMVTGGADTVTARTAKFLIGSFVPVVGSALSEALGAARGCLKLIKTTVGAYGIIVAAFTFLPILLQTMIWYLVTNIAAIAGDILGVDKVSSIMKSCSGVLGILISIILCFALLIIVSTAVVIATGMGTA